MKNFKYVTGLDLSDINRRQVVAILFSTDMTHKEAAKLFGLGYNIIGAGFGRLSVDTAAQSALTIGVSLDGRSESLDLGRHALDLRYVRRALGLDDSTLSDQQRKDDYSAAADFVRKRRMTMVPRDTDGNPIPRARTTG